MSARVSSPSTTAFISSPFGSIESAIELVKNLLDELAPRLIRTDQSFEELGPDKSEYQYGNTPYQISSSSTSQLFSSILSTISSPSLISTAPSALLSITSFTVPSISFSTVPSTVTYTVSSTITPTISLPPVPATNLPIEASYDQQYNQIFSQQAAAFSELVHLTGVQDIDPPIAFNFMRPALRAHTRNSVLAEPLSQKIED